MTSALPQSVKLTIAGMVLFVLGGLGFVLPVYGVTIPSPFAELFGLCILVWPPVLIAAVVAHRRERKRDVMRS